MLNYFFIYIVNPFFYLLDFFYEKYDNIIQKEETYELSKYYKCYYDIENDKVIIPYKNIEDKEYILKIDRKINLNLKNKIEELKNTINEEDPYVSLLINGKEKNVKKFFGPNGLHDEIQKLTVNDILFSNEINTFERLELMDNFCDYKEIEDLHENIL